MLDQKRAYFKRIENASTTKFHQQIIATLLIGKNAKKPFMLKS
jgi:hypothetical protein